VRTKIYQTPGSTSIANAGYCQTEQVMFVRFKRNPNMLYAYQGVTPANWQEFKKAPSKGGWVARNLVAVADARLLLLAKVVLDQNQAAQAGSCITLVRLTQPSQLQDIELVNGGTPTWAVAAA
jgi:hypothetical protein